MGDRRVHTGFWWGKLKKGDHVKDLGVEQKTNIKIGFKGIGFEVQV